MQNKFNPYEFTEEELRNPSMDWINQLELSNDNENLNNYEWDPETLTYRKVGESKQLELPMKPYECKCPFINLMIVHTDDCPNNPEKQK